MASHAGVAPAASAPPLPPVGVSRDRRYFPELEAMRGIAIALVFVFHADVVLLAPFDNRNGAWPNPALAFVWAGHSGVTLFFVLSAFLLSLPFLDEAYGGRPVSRSQFYARRALRILPLYWAAVVAGTLAAVTYRLIERPFLVRKARIGPSVRPSPARRSPRSTAVCP